MQDIAIHVPINHPLLCLIVISVPFTQRQSHCTKQILPCSFHTLFHVHKNNMKTMLMHIVSMKTMKMHIVNMKTMKVHTNVNIHQSGCIALNMDSSLSCRQNVNVYVLYCCSHSYKYKYTFIYKTFCTWLDTWTHFSQRACFIEHYLRVSHVECKKKIKSVLWNF